MGGSGVARYVGVPSVAGRPRRVLVGVNHQDFWMTFQPVAVLCRVNVQIAEPPSQGLVLFDGKFLIAEEKRLVFEPCPLQGSEVRL